MGVGLATRALQRVSTSVRLNLLVGRIADVSVAGGALHYKEAEEAGHHDPCPGQDPHTHPDTGNTRSNKEHLSVRVNIIDKAA